MLKPGETSLIIEETSDLKKVLFAQRLFGFDLLKTTNAKK